MVLDVAYVAISAVLPSQYWLRVFGGLAILYAFRAFAQGRKTTRERDLHARVVLLTVADSFYITVAFTNVALGGIHAAWADPA